MNPSPPPLTRVQLPAGPWLVVVRDRDDLARVAGTVALARQVEIQIAIAHTAPADLSATTFHPEIRRFPLGREAPRGEQLAALIRDIVPRLILLPAPVEADEAVRQLTREVEQAAGGRSAGWYYPTGGGLEANRRVDISAVMEQKRCALGESPLPATGETAQQEGFWAVERLTPGAGPTDLISLLAARSAGQPREDLRISVLVRTKDRPRLLAEALSSLLLQAYPLHQVVVINDGGQPLAAVVAPFRERLPIQLIEYPASVGRSGACNAGIAAATGDWLLVLDDDDLYLPGGVAALAAAVVAEDCVYYGGVVAFLYEGETRRLLRSFGGSHPPDLMLFENQLPFIGCLLPLNQVRAVGGVDESLPCFEDWDLFLRLMERCRFVAVDHLVAEYRSFGESFITGKGGIELQREGLTRIFTKHAARLRPERLAAMQLAVKGTLLPREIEQQCAPQLAAERDRQQQEHAQQIALRETLHAGTVAALRAELERAAEERQALIRRTLLTREELFVSVVIVNYNGRHHLERCLPSVFETAGVRLQLLVVDNGSQDGSVPWLKERWPQVEVIETGANLGFGRANLIGARHATAGYLALLNSDTVVTPDWLTHLLVPLLADPEVGASCSLLRLLDRPGILNARGGGMSRLGFGYDIDFGCPYDDEREPPEPVEVLFPSGAAMLVRRREFLELGAFDPGFFMYHEDVDLGWRYWLLGRRVLMCPRSVVFHAFGGTTKTQQGAGFRDFMGNRHNLRTLLKHYEAANAARAVGQLLGGWLRSGQLALAAHVLWWNALHVRGTVRERRRLQRLRRFSDAEIFARGLIPDQVPAAPELPQADPERDAASWLCLPYLFPGRPSGVGRLGEGWHLPESMAGEPVRATCGSATLYLRVETGAAGTLAVDLHLPDDLRPLHPVTLLCNGEEQCITLPPVSLWARVEIPAQADGRGVIALTLRAPSWVPCRRYGHGDVRRLGVWVRQVQFRSEAMPPPPPPARLSVLITTFNRWPILELTLDALRRQSLRDFEVIVVDDGSSDGTWENLGRWRERHAETIALKTVRQENTGQGIARNRGLRLAEGDLVLFLGDDIIPEEDLLAQHLERHRQIGQPCAVVGYTSWDREGMRVTPLLAHVNEQGQQFGYAHMEDGSDVPFTCFYTSNLSLPRAVLGEEPFDPAFRTYGWEDVEAGYRLTRQGLRILFARAARARHRHPMSLREFFRRQVKVGAAMETIYARHPQLLHEQPLMPAARPPRWWPALRAVVPALVPLMDLVDRWGVRLPGRLYDLVMAVGFWNGRAGRRR